MYGLSPYGMVPYGQRPSDAASSFPEPAAGGSVRFLLMGLRSLLLVILYG